MVIGKTKLFVYDDFLGRWWEKRAADGPHRRAYRKIARYIHDSLSGSPGLIVDYACGPGDLLCRLAWRFPQSRLVGLDGSRELLALARARIVRMGRMFDARISLAETKLPDFSRPAEKADLVVFAFPNMVPFSADDDLLQNERALEKCDLRAAQLLSSAKDGAGEDGAGDPEAIRFSLVQGRLVSLNLRRLLKKGGLCIRVEYAKARRHELAPLDLVRVSFEEGSLENEADGISLLPWFRVVASCFFRSRVTEDVYQQTRDKRDRDGGYLITVLRAI